MKKIVALIFFFLIQICNAQMKIERDDGCIAYFPTDFSSDVKWTGNCKDGKADGLIKFSQLNNNITSKFENGYLNGTVTLTSKNPFMLYQCEYKNSKKNGICISRYGKYEDYVSRYVDGRELEGSGYKAVMLYPEKDRHQTRQEGEFHRGELDGYGKMTFLSTLKEKDRLIERSNGKWRVEGSNLVAEGLWSNGDLVTPCSGKVDCAQARRSRDILESNSKNRLMSCQSQQVTCIASCPYDRVFTTLPDSTCKSRCESVSCN